MGELKIKLPNELEMAFRKAAMRRFGYQKGSISEAAKEAIGEWSSFSEDTKDDEDPIESISGLMKHVKKSSVQLQHEAWDYITDKYSKKIKKQRK